MTEQPENTSEQIGTDAAVDSDGQAQDQELYHGYSVDDETQPQGTQDSLTDDRDLPEPLDEGYSPPEKWSVAQGYGNTPLEEQTGESLEQRLAQEVPEPDPFQAAADETEHVEGEVGGARSGRLVAEDEGAHEDEDKGMVATDVGIDGFTLNWWGADNPTDANLRTLLAVARRSAFAVTVDVDLNSPFWAGPGDLAAALVYLRRYFDDPAWLPWCR